MNTFRLRVPSPFQPLARWMCLVTLACSGALMGARSVSAAPSEDEVRDWLVTELRQARAIPNLGRARVTVHHETHWYPVGEEWERLDREVKAAPDHPEAYMHAHYQLRRTGKPTLKTQYIWIRDPESFRLSEDHNSPTAPPGSMLDACVTPTNAFGFNQSVLTIYNRSEPWPRHSDLSKRFGGIVQTIRTLLFGGLSMAGCANVKVDTLALKPDGSWIAELSCPQPTPNVQASTFRVRGRWGKLDHGEREVGLIETVTLTNRHDPQEVGVEYRALDWRYSEVLQRSIATRVEYYRGNGQLDHAIHLVDLKLEDKAYFESLFRNPVNYKDAFRADTEFDWVCDYLKTPDGNRVEIKKTAATTLVPTGSSRGNRGVFVWAIVLVGIIVALGGVVFAKTLLFKKVIQ